MSEDDTSGVIPESKIREAHAKCMEDPALAKYFNDAPQGAKEYIALMFYCTVFQQEVDDVLYETYQKEVEEELTREDVLYLATHDRNPQSKAHFRDLLAQMPASAPVPAVVSPSTAPTASAPVVLDTHRLEVLLERLQSTLSRIESRLAEQEERAAKFRNFRFVCQVFWLFMVFLLLIGGAVALCFMLMPKQ